MGPRTGKVGLKRMLVIDGLCHDCVDRESREERVRYEENECKGRPEE